MTKKKSNKTRIGANNLNYKLNNSYNNNDVLHKIKVFHLDLQFKDRLNSNVISSMQRDLDRLCGLEKEVLYIKRQVAGIQENKSKIHNLKEYSKTLSSFTTFTIIILIVVVLVLFLKCFYKVIT